MATISIDIPEARVDEIKIALGNGVLLTNAQAKAAIVALLKDHVRNYYQTAAFNAAQSNVNSAIASQDNAVAAAKTNIDGINIS